MGVGGHMLKGLGGELGEGLERGVWLKGRGRERKGKGRAGLGEGLEGDGGKDVAGGRGDGDKDDNPPPARTSA